MPGRTLPQLRRGTGRLLGLRVFSGTSSSSGGSTTNLRDSVTLEVYPIHPSLFTDMLNQTVSQLRHAVGRAVIDESFVVDSPLWNPGMEDWTSSTALTGYTIATSTLGRESDGENVLRSQYSAKISTAAGSLSTSVAQRMRLSRLQGYSPTLYAWVKCDTASCARLALIDDDGTTNGSYHTGGNNWELLSVTRTLRSTDPSAPDSINIRLLHDVAAGTTYLDRWWIEGGPAQETYRVPGTLPDGPSAVYVARILDREHFTHDAWRPISFRTKYHEDENATTGYTEIWAGHPRGSGLWAMRLDGRDAPTTLSAETDTLECDETTAELIQVSTGLMILDQARNNSPLKQVSNVDTTYATLKGREKFLLKKARERGTAAYLPSDL